jgi:hypothetical protein
MQAVDDLIAQYEQGDETKWGVLSGILFLSREHSTDDIIDSLPEPWREDFIGWARARYDNDKPLEAYILISQGPTDDRDLRVITAIRDWFRRHPTSAR